MSALTGRVGALVECDPGGVAVILRADGVAHLVRAALLAEAGRAALLGLRVVATGEVNHLLLFTQPSFQDQ